MRFTLDPAMLAPPEPDPWAVAGAYRSLPPQLRQRSAKHSLADEVEAVRLGLRADGAILVEGAPVVPAREGAE
jgi:hypothetical protein